MQLEREVSKMNNLQIFNSNEFGEIRVLDINSEPWFVGKDVAEVLGYSNPQKAIRMHIDEDDKGVNEMDTPGGIQKTTIINESGLYSLILSSKLPNAKKFKKWVTGEVLPTIRKHGTYMTDEVLEKAITSPDFLIQLATKLKEEKELNTNLKLENKIKEQQIKELKPKADYTDRILNSKSLVTISQIAKDYGMSGTALNDKLHELKVQYKQSGQWLLYAKYQAKGYTHSETTDLRQINGTDKVIMRTKWTQKGRLFLYDLLKKNGVLPVIERN